MRYRLVIPLVLIFALLLAGCTGLAAPLETPGSPAEPTQVASVAATATPTVEVSPSPTTAPTSTPSPTASPSPSATATPVPSPTISEVEASAAIRALIERANQAQEDAFAKGDSALLRDTATAEYYDEISDVNERLADAGIKSIKLLKIEWGPIDLKGPTTAEATTWETWRTVFADGTTEDGRDRNVYALVLERGAWKVEANDHPDSGQASSAGSATPGTRPSTPAPSLTPSPDHDASHNWSGYAAADGKYTAVSGTWTVPSPEASGELGVGAAWVGIGGTTTRDLIQAGTQEMTIGTGRIRYNAWIETLPDPSRVVPLVIAPGDSITVSITETSKDQWLVVLKNNTTGQSHQETIRYASSYSSAEWIVEAPSSARSLLPLSDFGTVTFSEGTATRDGKSVSIAQAKATPISMVDAEGSVLALPSALAADGKGFSVTRTDTPATAQPTAPRRQGR